MSDPDPSQTDPAPDASPVSDSAASTQPPASDGWQSPPDTVAVPPTPKPPVRISFEADGAEYFRIWITNIALTVVTLGIYSAWAKVRRQQYFYRTTRLDGSSFDYHGQPLAILKGRLVGFALFSTYSWAGYVSPIFAVFVAVCIAAIMTNLASVSAPSSASRPKSVISTIRTGR